MPFSKKDYELESQDVSDQDGSDEAKDTEELDEESSKSVTVLSLEGMTSSESKPDPPEDSEKEPQNQVCRVVN